MRRFSEIVVMAAKHHNAEEISQGLGNVRARSAAEISSLSDDRILSLMAYRIFCSGFSHKVIIAKWPAFEEAFWCFDPARCAAMSDDDFDGLLANKSIVRNGAKISSVRDNAGWILELSREHGSAARFFAEWPDDRNVELLDLMKRRGSRLGGETGMRLLRAIGKPAFVLTTDVIAALIREGVVDSAPTSKTQMKAVQKAMNGWSQETSFDLTVLSRYLAWSVGGAGSGRVLDRSSINAMPEALANLF